jgi:hypothetical protein
MSGPQSQLAKRRKAFMEKLISDHKNHSLGYQRDHLNAKNHMKKMRAIAKAL